MQRVRTERDWISTYLQADRRLVLSIAAFATVVITVAEAVMPSVGLGLMYIFPILAFAGFVGRIEIALIALVCTVLRRQFSIDPAEQVSYLRLLLVFSTFYVSGLFVSEICRNAGLRRPTLRKSSSRPPRGRKPRRSFGSSSIPVRRRF